MKDTVEGTSLYPQAPRSGSAALFPHFEHRVPATEADSWPAWALLLAYSKSQMGLCAFQQPLEGILVTIETGPIGFFLKKSLDSIPSAHKPPLPKLTLEREMPSGLRPSGLRG